MSYLADKIMDYFLETGEMPNEVNIVELCAEARDSEWAQARCEALERAIKQAGWQVIDVTTDDDDADVFELVPPEVAA